MEEYRAHFQSLLIPDSEREYYLALTEAYKKASALIATPYEYKDGTWRLAKLKSIVSEIEKELISINSDFATAFKKELPEFTMVDAMACQVDHEAVLVAGGASATTYAISKAKIEELTKLERLVFTYRKKDNSLTSSSIEFSNALLNPSAQTIKAVRSKVMAGAIVGHSPDRIVKDLYGDFIVTNKSNMRTTVRTILGEASARANKQYFDEVMDNGDSWLFIATLDLKTSSICRSLDGRRWKQEPPAYFQPKLHPNCRSQLALVPASYSPKERPINLMTGADYKKVRTLKGDARDAFRKSKVTVIEGNLTYKEAIKIEPALNNKKTIDADEYFRRLGYSGFSK